MLCKWRVQLMIIAEQSARLSVNGTAAPPSPQANFRAFVLSALQMACAVNDYCRTKCEAERKWDCGMNFIACSGAMLVSSILCTAVGEVWIGAFCAVADMITCSARKLACLNNSTTLYNCMNGCLGFTRTNPYVPDGGGEL